MTSHPNCQNLQLDELNGTLYMVNGTLYMVNGTSRIILFFFLLLTTQLPLSAQSTEVEQDLFESMRQSDKAAVIAVHYGTCNEQQRQLCIERFNEKLRASFPDCTFREAWTSFPAVRQMKERGQTRQTLTYVLDALCMEGYTHVLVQPSSITDGVEMDYIRHEAAIYTGKFKQLRIGSPLLSIPGDYEKAILATAAAYGQKKTANVLVVGGEDNENPSQFAMLDYMLRCKGYENWFVVAEEGFPETEYLQQQLKQRKQKKVNLIPFVFAADDDLSVSKLKQTLEKAGYKVTLTPHALGEVDGISTSSSVMQGTPGNTAPTAPSKSRCRAF
ncbi:MAG: sirohydrochlorin cobaltochelatase [Bacteroidaceae bacterium]|nr:sirohydrochlorin cobaltochelatase [Bacteroidaceae bacterium]